VITPSLPGSGEDGPAAQAFLPLRNLAQHCDIHLFCYSEKESDEQIEELLACCAKLVVVRLPNRNAPSPSWEGPQGVRRYDLPQMKKYVEEFVAAARLGVVQVESARLAFWGKWLRRLPVAKVLLEYEAAFQDAGRAAARWNRHEIGNLLHFDRVAVFSQGDRELLLQRHFDPSKIRMIPSLEGANEGAPAAAEALAALYGEISRLPPNAVTNPV
jgi:hypothetical protein